MTDTTVKLPPMPDRILTDALHRQVVGALYENTSYDADGNPLTEQDRRNDAAITALQAAPARAELVAAPAAIVQPTQWRDDKPDEWTPLIDASHPMNTGAHKAYATALEMVGNRRSKDALVQLVCWLIQLRAPFPQGDGALTEAAKSVLADLEHRAKWWRQWWRHSSTERVSVDGALGEDFARELDRAVAALRDPFGWNERAAQYESWDRQSKLACQPVTPDEHPAEDANRG